MNQVRRLLDAPPAPLPRVDPEELLRQAERTGLRGRGGGGFPVARKLRAAREARGRAVVVVNAAEGEPASRKDRTLLARAPHLVLDGALLSAQVVGAREVVVAVHAGRGADVRTAAARLGADVRVVEVADGYVRSEASALVSALTGGSGLPAHRTAPLAQEGPGRRPWLVQNAESAACLALLTRHGPGWYEEVGTEDEAGTQLLTLGGAVRSPQVVELPIGTRLREAVDCAGGVAEPVQAVLVGGFAGRWTTEDLLLRRSAGGRIGAGILLALPVGACGLVATADVVDYLAAQSARQCGPCLNGLPALARALRQLADGRPPRETVERLHHLCGLVAGRGACSHPDGAVALVRSALEVFADDVAAHLAGTCGRPAYDLGVPA